MESLFHQQAISTKIDKPSAADELIDNGGDLRVKQWLASGYTDHRRAAFFSRPHTFLNTEMIAQHLCGVVHFAAAFAAQVTAKERFEHQHQGKAFLVLQYLTDNILSDTGLLNNWYSHQVTSKNHGRGSHRITSSNTCLSVLVNKKICFD